MKQFGEDITAAVRSILVQVRQFILNHLKFIPAIIYVASLVLAYRAGQDSFLTPERHPGSIILILIALAVIGRLFGEYATVKNKGNGVPIPRKRFTTVTDGDEVTVDVARVQELLVYVGDLEDWLEQKGLAKTVDKTPEM